MCLRARRRSSWTSVRKGLSVIRRVSLAKSLPIRAEARGPRIVYASPPGELPTDAGHPQRAQKDPSPHHENQWMEEDRGQDGVAESGEEDDPDERDQRDGGDGEVVGGEGQDEGKDVDHEREGENDRGERVAPPEHGEHVLGEA